MNLNPRSLLVLIVVGVIVNLTVRAIESRWLGPL